MQMVVIQAKPLAIPIKELQTVALTAPKGKHRAARRLLAQHVLRQRRQTCDPLAHICRATGQIDPNTGARPDHAPSTARINRVNAFSSMSLSNRSMRPFARRSSIQTEGTGLVTAGRSGMDGAPTGRNSAPASGDQRPFRFSS